MSVRTKALTNQKIRLHGWTLNLNRFKVSRMNDHFGPWSALSAKLYNVKRRVFISFHHANDRYWFDRFSRLFHDNFEVFTDNSVDDPIQSENPEYVNRAIRERFIFGTSITILLCGSETWKRRHVDWEIHSTLFMEHALLGIALPTALRNPVSQNVTVPNRLHANVQNKHAHFINWTEDAQEILVAIETAISMSKSGIRDNSFEKMARNLT